MKTVEKREIDPANGITDAGKNNIDNARKPKLFTRRRVLKLGASGAAATVLNLFNPSVILSPGLSSQLPESANWDEPAQNKKISAKKNAATDTKPSEPVATVSNDKKTIPDPSPTPKIDSTPTAVKSAETDNSKKDVSLGKFATVNPEIFIPGTDIRIVSDIPKGAFQVVGFGEKYRFKIISPETNTVMEVPIEEIEVLEGNPVKETVTSSVLGIRNDIPDLMPLVDKMGASRVRIALEDANFQSNPNIKKAIELAKEKKLGVLLNFNTQGKLTDDQIKERIAGVFAVLNNYGEVEFELGNEPDNQVIPFWKDRDLSTFAQFVKISAGEIKKVRSDAKIIVGALIDVNKTQALIECLEKAGADMNSLDFAVHAYHTYLDVQQRMTKVRSVTKKAPHITELGAKDKSKDNLLRILNEAYNLNPQSIFLHELPNWEGFGFVDPAKGNKPINSFYIVQCWAQEHK